MIKKYPLAAYYSFTFGWTWCIVTVMILTGQTNVENPTPAFILGGIICNISPSIAAFIVTRITEGKSGVKILKEGFMKRSSPLYLLLAILIVPMVTAITAILSNQIVREYRFRILLPMVIMGLIWPLFSSMGEEFGWRGFILPKMLAKYGVLKAGIILGIIWEIWHLPMHYIGFQDYGAYMLPAFLLIGFVNLTLQSVIMAFIFAKSKGNIRLMVLYHYTITSSSILLGALFETKITPQLIIYESVISVILFSIFAGFLYLSKRRDLVFNKEEQSC
jgi:membrane protease YdiL (CAAX protease family)